MTDVNEFHVGAGYYEFPDGVKVRGKEKAEEYAAELEELDAVVEEVEEEEAVEEPVAETPAPKPVAEEKDFLMQMTRKANLFEIVGSSGKTYKFGQKTAPILVVKSEDVGELLAQGGFRLVSPDVAKEYYS